MTPTGFLKRLHSRKVVNCTYQSGELVGLISAWQHAGAYVLTWEECREGDQYNEQNYTRDERHLFETAETLLAFLERSGYDASAFGP